jgi:hypothetical protein
MRLRPRSTGGLVIVLAGLCAVPGCTREAEEAPDAAPAPTAPPTEGDAAREARVLALLEAHVRRHALADPDDTWALVHALLVLPPATPLPAGGTLAEATAARATVADVHGRSIPVFTGQAAGGNPREPHRDQVVRALLASGVPLDHAFEAGGARHTVADLLEGALWRFEAPTGAQMAQSAWTVMALAEAVRGGREAEFQNHRGQTFDGRVLAARAAAFLNDEMTFIETARDRGVALQKRREGVHAHPCGGFHTAQAPAAWLFDEAARKGLEPQLKRAAATLAFRLGAEQAIYAQARAQHPEHALILTVQELKFYGHWLEAMADLRDGGIPVDANAVARARALLVDAVERLVGMGVFERMDEIRTLQRQVWLDLIGDSAHALRGLRAWSEV